MEGANHSLRAEFASLHEHQPSGSSQPLPDTVLPAPRTSGPDASATSASAEGGQRYTLKFLREPEDLPPETLARFQNEARAVAQLDHPHIIKIFDIGDNLVLPGVPVSP